ncbi:stage II sporulation protein D [Symbiobacterium thermophilum]|uniref:Stage II sporulation protein D n=1 Tax=Symbiobacterium thermophilum (strain DSM 24528 / JCM 14929 / IAM 14863 / T) TaxID=292459 RepID=Q67TA7_SYMTH|nr:stage II sporulation protein D [Symbiobacterium thermophilum]BAD39086.1 stage II sporulation protein D [Symbiobacterium thermophilum IAM 14863]
MLRLLLAAVLMTAALTLALPAGIGAGVRMPQPPDPLPVPVLVPWAPEPEAPVDEPAGADSLDVKVYFPDRDAIVVMPLGEYLKGVVAAEMPADFEMEALKAQFVVARTYTVRRMPQFGGQGGCPLNPEADVCADYRTSQAYMSREELEAKYGPLAAASFWRRLSQAQAETEGEVLTYQGELIDALYHAVSGRMTESSGDYFATDLPYLMPVDDTWGAAAPRLVDERRFSPEAFVRALGLGSEEPLLAVQAAARVGQPPVQVTARTAGGRVKTVAIGGMTLTGRQVRERLGLRSTDFRVYWQDGEIVVETFGDGHGVGMSQYGAQGMARAGKTYREILTHYYTGVELSRLFEINGENWVPSV